MFCDSKKLKHLHAQMSICLFETDGLELMSFGPGNEICSVVLFVHFMFVDHIHVFVV